MSEQTQLPPVLADAREDLLPSLVRHVVPALVGLVLSVAFVREFGATFGITQGMWEQAATTVVTALWYAAWRAVEVYWPRLSGAASLILGLGVGAPQYTPRHRAAGPADAGYARLWLPVTGAVVVLAVALVAAPTGAAAAARPPVLPIVTVAGDCDGALVVAFDLATLRGRHLTTVLDDGRQRLELLEVSGRSQPGGHWTRVDAVSGGEGRLRWPGYRASGTQGAHWGLARIVRTDRDRVVSLPAAIGPGCVA